MLVRIILPLSAPALVTTGLLAFIAAWNEFMFALAFTSNIDHQTIPVGIANFTNLYYVPWGDIAAASVVVTVPADRAGAGSSSATSSRASRRARSRNDARRRGGE